MVIAMKKKNLLYIGGSKGGTGKSMVCMALVDYLRKKASGDEILLIETDTSNPDVGRVYNGKGGVIVKGFILDEEESGWFELINTIAETTASYIVINSMAASNRSIRSQGALLDENIANGRIQTDFNVFWVMNRNKDSVLLLQDFMTHMKHPVVFPVLNLYFGKEEEFLFYRQGQTIHDLVTQRGGRQLVFPSLNDLIADRLYSDDMSLEDLPQYLKLGMRIGLERWLALVEETFNGIFSFNARE
jgi:hypothetical protein